MRKRRKFKLADKKKAALRLALLLAAFVAIAAAVYGLVSLFKNRTVASALTPMGFVLGDNYTFSGSGFLYFSGDKLIYDDIADNKKDTTYKVSTGDVSLAASTGISVLYHDTAVQIIGAQDALVFSGSVRSVACGNTHVAVLREDSGGNVALLIYDKTGTQTDQMDFKTTTPVAFGFSNTADETLWTLEIGVSGSLPVSSVTTYNLSTQRTTGVMTVQSQLIDKVLFTQNSVFLSGTDNIIRYALPGNSEAYRLVVYGWKLLDYTFFGSAPLMLYAERNAQTVGTVKLYQLPEGDVADASIHSVQLPAGTVGMFVAGGKFYACTADTMYVYTAAGKLSTTISLTVSADSVTKLSDSYMLVESGGALYTLSLK